MLLVTNSLKFRESTSDPFQKLSLSANFDAPVAVENGGTGADNAADARTNLGLNGLAPMPTVVLRNATSSAYEVDATYTVHGNGVVVVYASMPCAANDYGTWQAQIFHNGNLIMGSGTRFTTSVDSYFGAMVSAPIQVVDGDRIRIWLKNTKAGSKPVFRRFLCFGCTVS